MRMQAGRPNASCVRKALFVAAAGLVVAKLRIVDGRRPVRGEDSVTIADRELRVDRQLTTVGVDVRCFDGRG